MELKYYIMKYVLKICGTAVLLTPFLYLFVLILLSILPNHHVPELIGLLFLIYIAPYTLLFNIITALGLFLVLNYYTNAKRRVIKSVISILSVFIIFSGFKLLFLAAPLDIYTNNYLLATIISITLLTFIWYYEYDPEITAKLSATPIEL